MNRNHVDGLMEVINSLLLNGVRGVKFKLDLKLVEVPPGHV